MKIGEALPSRSVVVVIEIVDNSGVTIRKETKSSKELVKKLLDLEYLAVIPQQKRYVFYVREKGGVRNGNQIKESGRRKGSKVRC